MPGTSFALENLIIWSDEDLLVVNKPAGIITLTDGYDPGAPYLLGLFKQAYERLWVVHRLDRETSGILVLARTPDAHRELNAQFSERRVSKTYHALIVGAPLWDEKTVKLHLRPDGDRKHRTVVDSRQGKPANTHFRVIERFGRYTLVEAVPQTGRTHQIRVHLASQGFAIATDGLYGDGKGVLLSEIKPGYRESRRGESPLLGRLGLHAWSLSFTHPTSGEIRQFEASYPKDFAATIRQLRKYKS